MKISLVVMTAGKSAGQAIPIPTAQFIIGRDPQCNLRPASAMISKRHCAILVKNNQVYLRDFGSTNGTFLNEVPVKGEAQLKNGDLLKVGPLLFKLALEGAPEQSKSAPPLPPKRSDIMDDDAAAMMLNLDDDEGVSVTTTTAETENSVPAGTTLMEIPGLQAALDQLPKEPAESTENKPAESKPPESKAPESKPAEHKPADTKKKPPAGSAQDSARAILEKMKQGRRK